MTERERIEQTIAALEAQRAILGDTVVETALAPLRQRLAALSAPPEPPPPTPARSSAEAQRKLVTVLFADVSGFTAMSETLDAEEVREVMNTLWQRLDGAILAHGGLIDKHIGDAVMALWGAQTAREDDPEQAIRAALDMQRELYVFAEETHRETPLQMRIGINTGLALLGAVGTTGEFTAMGDTVNLASRLEHAAPIGGILISHDTYRHVRGLFDVQPLEPMTIKGKAEPVRTYVVQRAKPRAFRLGTRGVQGVETRMIGREAELGALQRAWRAVIEERTLRAVTVVADAGVGKSRLLYEFSNWIELQPQRMLFFRGRAGEGMVSLPYSLVRDVFQFSFDIREGDPLATARDKLERGFVEALGADGVEQAHFVGHLLGFEFREAGSPYLRGLADDARQIRARAFHAAAQFFTAVPARATAGGDYGAVMILLEDIHWADDDSLALIEHIARECQSLPIFVISLSRPSLFMRRAAWGEEGFAAGMHTRVDLQPLTDAASLTLVAEILRQSPESIPSALRNLIVGRAEGNPYYIEELIKMLIESGVIVASAAASGQWKVKIDRLVEGQVPPTLTGILQARLDRLQALEREAIQRAAVVGRVFWDSAVACLHDGNATPARSLEPAWGVLQQKEMVFPRQASTFAGGHEFIFKHAIFHSVTYESVLKRLRKVYHAQVAAWLVERSGERVNEYAGLIGEHYERAGEMAQAAEWYGRAGRQAQDTYAPEAAINYYRKAVDLALPSTDAVWRTAIYDGLGEMLLRQARFTEAVEAYTAMRAVAETIDDAAAQARAWNGLAAVQAASGDYRAALESAGQVETIAQTVIPNQPDAYTDVQIEVARALYRRGAVNFRLGNAEAVLSLGERALAISRQVGARREIALSFELLALVHETMLGQPEQAVHYYEQALEVFRELGNRLGVGGMLNNLGENARLRRDFKIAVARYQEALKVAREIGAREGEISSLSNLGGARIGLGEYAAAEANLREAIGMAGTSGWGWLSETYRFLADACLGQGKLTDALEAAQRALALGHETGSKEDIGRAWRTLGIIQSRQPRAEPDAQAPGAAACFAESYQVFTEAGLEAEQARTLREWASHDLRGPDHETGQRRWQEARSLFERLGMSAEVADMDRIRPTP